MNKIIIFPTDTVYGIGASLYDLDNINKIYEIKGRSFDKQLPVLCSSIEQIESFAVIDNNVLKLAKAFWPGALTLILKTKDEYFKF
ncbi:MAG TPA: threonylcarbamoyl-AMP synthase, partial [Acholeplasma sp.]|nr:threonylcarbamoyl-AMP synthase [Acholeplasma sp.]